MFLQNYKYEVKQIIIYFIARFEATTNPRKLYIRVDFIIIFKLRLGFH